MVPEDLPISPQSLFPGEEGKLTISLTTLPTTTCQGKMFALDQTRLSLAPHCTCRVPCSSTCSRLASCDKVDRESHSLTLSPTSSLSLRSSTTELDLSPTSLPSFSNPDPIFLPDQPARLDTTQSDLYPVASPTTQPADSTTDTPMKASVQSPSSPVSLPSVCSIMDNLSYTSFSQPVCTSPQLLSVAYYIVLFYMEVYKYLVVTTSWAFENSPLLSVPAMFRWIPLCPRCSPSMSSSGPTGLSISSTTYKPSIYSAASKQDLSLLRKDLSCTHYRLIPIGCKTLPSSALHSLFIWISWFLLGKSVICQETTASQPPKPPWAFICGSPTTHDTSFSLVLWFLLEEPVYDLGEITSLSLMTSSTLSQKMLATASTDCSVTMECTSSVLLLTEESTESKQYSLYQPPSSGICMPFLISTTLNTPMMNL